MHSKMHQDNVTKFYQQLYTKHGHRKWKEFSSSVKQQSNREDDYKLIDLEKLEAVLKEVLDEVLTAQQRNLLFNTSGRVSNGRKQINITQIYSTKFLIDLDKMYDKLPLIENEEDTAVDNAGYTGDFRRKNLNLPEITEEEFIEIVKKDNKLAEIMKIILQIDREYNGYVTITEMDDILKLIYPDQLEKYSLKSLLKVYCSSANKVLLDYKQFRDYILEGLEGRYKNHDEIKINNNLLNLHNGILKSSTQMRLEEIQKAIEEERKKVRELKKEKEELGDKFDPYVNLRTEPDEDLPLKIEETNDAPPTERLNLSFDLIR